MVIRTSESDHAGKRRLEELDCETVEWMHVVLEAVQRWCTRNTVINLQSPQKTGINPFQSNFSATRILPSSYLFGRERGWWVTCNYPTVLKEKIINRNRKSTTCAIC
jgi:hypothetical protein